MEEVLYDQILCHPDKIEMFLRNTAGNSVLLPNVFPDLVQRWTEKFCLQWRSERNAWHWSISGWNHEVRLTLSGPATDIPRGACGVDLFSMNHLAHNYRNSRRGWTSILRITDKTKTQPSTYCQYLTRLFEDLETMGVEEKPRTIEIALDSYDKRLSDHVRNTVYLKRDNPLDFSHWAEGAFHPGGSPNGTLTEYSMRRTFRNRRGETRRQNTTRRELVSYTNPKHGFHRIELRLGFRYLSEFSESFCYHKAIESSVVPPLTRTYPVAMPSRTLDLIGFIPYFVFRQIGFGYIDLVNLEQKHQVTRLLSLQDKSLREQRYRLARNGLRVSVFPQPSPPVRFFLPEQVG